MYQEIVNTVLVYYSWTDSQKLRYVTDVTFDEIRIDKRLANQKEEILENLKNAIEQVMSHVFKVKNNVYELNKVIFPNIEDPRIIDIRDTRMGI